MTIKAGIAIIATIMACVFWYLPSLWIANKLLGPEDQPKSQLGTIEGTWLYSGYWEYDRMMLAGAVSLLLAWGTWINARWIVGRLDPD